MKIKKLLLVIAFTVMFSGALFAQSEKNKIGIVFGLPIGLSYTRSINNLVNIDLIAGFDLMRASIYGYGAFFIARCAPLFKLWTGPLGSIQGAFSLGPAVGFHIGTVGGYYDSYNNYHHYTAGGFSIGIPLRFELDFSVPCNMFFELVPGGFEGTFSSSFYDRHGHNVGSIWGYYLAGGIGVRFRF